jgi:transcriptional regulator with XRE-family HTH domain
MKALRQRRGMTQRMLADESNVPRSTIAAIEAGIQDGLSIEALIRVADGLGASVDMLIRDIPLEGDSGQPIRRGRRKKTST